ncbi:MAG TPA: hypothetical protein VIG80_03805 [Bacillaceae bacterium]
MMQWTKWLSIALISVLLLAACGTSGKDNTNGSENSQPKENNTGETGKTEKTQKEEPAASEKQPGNEKEDTEKIRLMEQNLSYKAGGEAKEETAFLKESDNQDYSMYVLPNYVLTGEEPNKDVLYYKEEDSHFMRIELLPSEISLEEAVTTAKEQLEAVDSKVEKGSAPEGHTWLSEAEIYTAQNGKDRVTAYLVKKEDWLLKLTVFTKLEDSHEDAFVKMAETIEKK